MAPPTTLKTFLPLPAPPIAASGGGGLSSGFLWLDWVIFFVLSCFSAMFAGLTLGLMSLDVNQLQLLIDAPDKDAAMEQEAKYAARILPVRKDGNFLLTTLVSGTTLVNSGIAILSTSIMGEGVVALLCSTMIIVVAGEIVPQAICSRFALAIGSLSLPFVRASQCLVYPWSWLISSILDWMLGEEVGAVYTRKQLKALIAKQAKNAEGLDVQDAQILTGALDFASVPVEDAMTPLDKVFGLEVDATFNLELISAIVDAGFSRVPVFDKHPMRTSDVNAPKRHIVGLLLVKDLLLLDPSSEVPVKTLLHLFGRQVFAVDNDTKLATLLADFKKGKSHMAIVRKIHEPEKGDPYWTHVGIITLEDVIEEILQDEVLDEHDLEDLHLEANIDCEKKDMAAAAAAARRAEALRLGRMSLLDKRRGQHILSEPEALAVSNYLTATQPQFSGAKVAHSVLQQLVSKLPVLTPQKGTQLYESGQQGHSATLVLQGKVKVTFGDFNTTLGPWSVLAMKCLDLHATAPKKASAALPVGTSLTKLPSSFAADHPTPSLSTLPAPEDMPHFVADFSAVVLEEGCRIVRIPQETYLLAVRATQLNQPFVPPQPAIAANPLLLPPAAHPSDPSLSVVVTKPDGLQTAGLNDALLAPPALVMGKAADHTTSPGLHALVAVTPNSPGLLVGEEPHHHRSKARTRTTPHTRSPNPSNPHISSNGAHTDGAHTHRDSHTDEVHILVSEDVQVELADMAREIALESGGVQNGGSSGK